MSGITDNNNDDYTNPIDIGNTNDFIEGKGREIKVKYEDRQRSISVFRYKTILYAIDHHCYHMGGPLSNGDIEDIILPPSKQQKNNKIGENHPCVVCPWHHYNISLRTGESIYKHDDPFDKTVKPCMKSRGKKQRTHIVHEDFTTGRVMIQLNISKNEIYESDRYSSEE